MDEKVRFTVRLAPELVKKIKVEAARRDVTMQTATEQALKLWLKGGER